MAATRGQEFLKQLVDAGTTQAEVARRLGVEQPAVSGWIKGRSRPGAHLRVALERHFQIPEVEWMTDDERRQAYGSVPPQPAAPDVSLPHQADPRNGTEG